MVAEGGETPPGNVGQPGIPCIGDDIEQLLHTFLPGRPTPRRAQRPTALSIAMSAALYQIIQTAIGATSEAAYTADIAERLVRIGRPGETVDWLKRSRRPFDDEDTTHIDLMVECE